MERNFKLSERLLDHVRKFRETAQEQVVYFVDSLDKPMKHGDRRSRSIPDYHDEDTVKNFELFCDEDFDVQSSQLVFYEPNDHNMLIKLTFPTDFIEKTSSEIEEPIMSGAEDDDLARQDQRNDPVQNGSFLKGESVKRQLHK